MYQMDAIDMKIIELLQKNARMSLKEIASEVFLTSPAVSARINKLEQNGIIRGYHAQICPEALSYQIKALISLKIDPIQKKELYDYVENMGNVIQCDYVTGDFEIFMEVFFHTTTELEQFIDNLQKFGDARAQIVFSTVVEHRGLPVEMSHKTNGNG